MSSTVTQPISDKAAKALEKADAWALGWVSLAAFLRQHDYLADGVRIQANYGLFFISADLDAVPFMERVIADAVGAGVKVEPYHGHSYAGIHLLFGPAYLQVYADADRVFASQVVGQIDDVQYAPLFSIPSQDGEEK